MLYNGGFNMEELLNKLAWLAAYSASNEISTQNRVW